ncbi:hypothetical protein GCM10009548_74260 [Streptomyces malaysiensis subsp. malaysiensis]
MAISNLLAFRADVDRFRGRLEASAGRPARVSAHRRTSAMTRRAALTPQPGTTRPRTTSRRLLQLATTARAGLPMPAAVETAGDNITLCCVRVPVTAGTTVRTRRQLRREAEAT